METVYSKDELINNAPHVFGVKPEVVAGALKLAGKSEMTRSDAEQAIQKFLKRKV